VGHGSGSSTAGEVTLVNPEAHWCLLLLVYSLLLEQQSHAGCV
jgi:hypothetical protein